MKDNLEPVELRSEAFAVSEETAVISDTSDNNISAVSTSEASAAQPPAKKMKKERDPNLPKKPLNSYFLFQRDYRPQFKEKHPNGTFDEFKEFMNATWKQLPAEKREYYDKLAKEHFAAHTKEVEEYNRKKASGENITESITEDIAENISDEKNDIVPVALPVVADIPMTSSDAETPKKKKKKNKNKEKRESQDE
jgi:hypothetical protein